MNTGSRKFKLPYRRCVGIVVFNKDGKVWAGRRIITSSSETAGLAKRWQMPQGGIDKDEDPLEAAKRELFEETGITSVELLEHTKKPIRYDLPKNLLGIALKGKYCGQEMAWFAFRFTGEESEINISNPPEGTPAEFDQWAWRDLNQMPDLIVDFKRPVYEKVIAAFGHLAPV